MSDMSPDLIAPCGINCRVCMAYKRKNNPCFGCRVKMMVKTNYDCKLKNCPERTTGTSGFCGECGSFPCKNLKHLDTRYRTKYQMSEIENLAYIQDNGMDAFLEQEEARWTCKTCSGLLCVHRPACPACGAPRPEAKDETAR